MDVLSAISLLVGVIGTAIAIYQWATLNALKARNSELQFLLAGINSSAAQKMQSWQNQIHLLLEPQNVDQLDTMKVMHRAKDDFADMSNLIVSLEGAIDPENSAISKMMDKYLDVLSKNNKMQAEAHKVAPTEAVKSAST